jgi:hypothetical protein
MTERERFLLYVFAGLLSWQAGLFTYAAFMCTPETCPQIGDRYETFVNTSLGAVLGLLAGSNLKK